MTLNEGLAELRAALPGRSVHVEAAVKYWHVSNETEQVVQAFVSHEAGFKCFEAAEVEGAVAAALAFFKENPQPVAV